MNENISLNIEEKETIYKKIKNSICKIIINEIEVGYGFFCKICHREKSNILPFLITNYSILSLEYIKTNLNLKISLNEGNEIKTLSLNDSRIYYTNKDLNITIIEIKPDIDELNSFLEIDENIFGENIGETYKNKNIYIIEKPHFKRDFISISQLQNINNNTIEFLVQTAFGCRGTPIFNLDNNKIIGINMNENPKENNNNYCMRNIIDEFNKRNEIIICLSNKKTKKNIYFLNCEDENMNNSKEIKDSISTIYIDGKEEIINNYFLPDKKGFHIIKIKFKNMLINCHKLFYKCKDIVNIDLSSFNIKNIQNMSYMFYSCSNLKNVNLSSINGENIIDLSFIFSGCSNLTNLDLSTFKIKNVQNMQNMFSLCINLIEVNLSFFNTEKVNNMSYMFQDCHILKNLDLTSFDTKNVTKINNIFDSCLELTNLKLGNINTSNIISMEKMFYDCMNLLKIDELPLFNTQNVTNMNGIFYNCQKIKELNLSSFNTENVTDMNKMFSHCKSLTNIDVSHFVTNKVTNMKERVSYCTNLININLSNFNIENVADMSDMFSFCTYLLNINLPTFELKQSTSMNKMFYSCSSITNIELNFKNINNKLDINNIFSNCYSLRFIDLSSLDSSNIKNISMFCKNCYNLIGIKVNKNSYLDFKYSNSYNLKIFT